MGYNGGINKRGYYRRNNGMYKKSSYKSGERLIGNIIASGIGLLCSFSDLNIDSTQIEKQPPKEINIKNQNKNNNMQRHNISMPYLYNFDIRICKLVDVLRRFLMRYNRNNIFEFSNFRK